MSKMHYCDPVLWLQRIAHIKIKLHILFLRCSIPGKIATAIGHYVSNHFVFVAFLFRPPVIAFVSLCWYLWTSLSKSSVCTRRFFCFGCAYKEKTTQTLPKHNNYIMVIVDKNTRTKLNLDKGAFSVASPNIRKELQNTLKSCESNTLYDSSKESTIYHSNIFHDNDYYIWRLQNYFLRQRQKPYNINIYRCNKIHNSDKDSIIYENHGNIFYDKER